MASRVLPLVSVLTGNSNTGAQAVHSLLARYRGKARVRACFRSAAKAAPFVAQYGHDTELFEAVDGVDAGSAGSLERALQGASYSVLVTPHDPQRGMAADAQLCSNMIQAAVQAQVRHIVYVGSWTVHAPQGVPALASRFVGAEEELARLGAAGRVRWTSLRAGFFLPNFLALLGPGIRQGTVRFPDLLVPAVDPADVGRAAAAVLAADDPGVHHGRHYDISGPEMLRVSEVAQAIAAAAGLPAPAFEAVAASTLAATLPPHLAELLLYMEAEGAAAVPMSGAMADLCGAAEHTRLTDWLAARRTVL